MTETRTHMTHGFEYIVVGALLQALLTDPDDTLRDLLEAPQKVSMGETVIAVPLPSPIHDERIC